MWPTARTGDDSLDPVTGIDWANQPGFAAAVTASAAAPASGQWIEFDVSSVVTMNASYAFALTSGSTKIIAYRSREAATNKPQLVVTVQP
jgi:hypothetical protein